jgi:hypothetical protein
VNLPSTFDAWFSRCLEREPENRFSTVQEAAAELMQIAGTPERHSVHPEVERIIVQVQSEAPALAEVANSTSAGLSSSPVRTRAPRSLFVAGAVGLVALGSLGFAISKFGDHTVPGDDSPSKAPSALAVADSPVQQVQVESVPNLALAKAPDLTPRSIKPGSRATTSSPAPAGKIVVPVNVSVSDAGARRPVSITPKPVESPGF